MPEAKVLTVNDSICWSQRIEKEKATAAGVPKSKFSVRAVVNVFDVPHKFKPGHIDPSKPCTKGFDPADYGWEPEGETAKQFRRALLEKDACPRQRFPQPQATSHEVGWLLDTPGEPKKQAKPAKNPRLGLGWEWKQPGESSLAAAPPPGTEHIRKGERRPRDGKRSSSELGAHAAGAETSTSVLSAAPPFSVLSCSAPEEMNSDSGSLLSAVAPSQLYTESQLSRATSLPGLYQQDREAYVRRREKRLLKAFEESRRYHKLGDKGRKYDKPLGETDVTHFSTEFIKATCGVPLHKFGRS